MGDEVRWYDVPEASGLWEGDLVGVDLAGEPVLVVHHVDDTWAAFQGMCPHQAILLSSGEWDEDKGTLLCSGHRWEIDMRTGRGINPEGCVLYRYPVEAADGRVRVGIPQDGLDHYNRSADDDVRAE